MQNTLPANGQAQTLPAKWVIERTYRNSEMVNEWANQQEEGRTYIDNKGFIHSEPVDTDSCTPLCLYTPFPGFTTITDLQFKAMVEGERGTPFQDQAQREDYQHRVSEAHYALEYAGEHDLAAALKAKHPDIWPVDYAAKILQSSIDVYRLCYEKEKPENYMPEMRTWMEDCRNYLTNQK